MNRIAHAVLLLAAAFASACATSGALGDARDDEPGTPPPPVAYGDEILRLSGEAQGFQRPELADPACLAYALRRAPGAAGVDNKVKFAVLRDGSLARFSYLTPVTEPQAAAVEEAFSRCRWNPGLDPAGHPVAVWVIQPIKVAGAP